MYRAYRDSSVVRESDTWSKDPGFESQQESRRIFFSTVNFLCWLLFQYQFHSRVTAVACKRSRPFCQKCRWQVTAKHTCTQCGFEWSDTVNWCMVEWGTQTLCRDGSSFTWHQPRNNQTVLSVHHFCGYSKRAMKRIHSIIQNHMRHKRSESAQEQRIELYKQRIALYKQRTALYKQRIALYKSNYNNTLRKVFKECLKIKNEDQKVVRKTSGASHTAVIPLSVSPPMLPSLENHQCKCHIWNHYSFFSFFLHWLVKGFSSKCTVLTADLL